MVSFQSQENIHPAQLLVTLAPMILGWSILPIGIGWIMFLRGIAFDRAPYLEEVISNTRHGLVIGAFAGALVGIFQYKLIRHYLRLPWLWIGASIIAWSIMAAGLAAAMISRPEEPIGLYPALRVGSAVTLGFILYGLIIGFTLDLLLNPKHTP